MSSMCQCVFSQSGFLPKPKDMQIRATSYSKLSVGVNVSVNVYLFISPLAL